MSGSGRVAGIADAPAKSAADNLKSFPPAAGATTPADFAVVPKFANHVPERFPIRLHRINRSKFLVSRIFRVIK